MSIFHDAPSSSSSVQPFMSLNRDHTFKSAPSKIFDNLKRTLTPGKASRPHSSEDRFRHGRSQSQYLQDDSAALPTVEQIAMGLHLSHTPHLPSRISPPLSSPTYHRLSRVESTPSPADRSYHFSRRHSPLHRPHASLIAPPRAVAPLPPPPSRSALKAPRSSTPSSSSPKASLQTFDSSSTPSSSAGPRTPSSHSSPARRFIRLSRFARGIVAGGGSGRLVANSQSTSEVSVTLSEPLRKSVRFEGTEGP
ncbi:hypothetical protein K488DRAFT_88991 [Vararia minispora EC-137]|uniref:Uncharacterized protein n=1 Tax=Vararia minispora EC-137 TaxID=1314806 RepID=A0ACB8QBL0_9AGAM|nr:hypothetical protein K488DRAFT_88991 [Vararia minispora EC-137]